MLIYLKRKWKIRQEYLRLRSWTWTYRLANASIVNKLDIFKFSSLFFSYYLNIYTIWFGLKLLPSSKMFSYSPIQVRNSNPLKSYKNFRHFCRACPNTLMNLTNKKQMSKLNLNLAFHNDFSFSIHFISTTFSIFFFLLFRGINRR